MENIKIYDTIIIGAGPAGMAAAIYAARAELSFCLIDRSYAPGGQVLSTYEVDNYPGLPGLSGGELSDAFKKHCDKLGCNFITADITDITPGHIAPNGFFNEMINNGSTLVIYIVNSIGDNIVGLTGTYSDGLAVILLGTDFGEDYYVTATHHEFMHYFDAYMKRRSGNTIDLSMSALNPSGFVYGDQSYNYVYMPMYGNASTAYFVSVYGKTSNLEDRATIFGELMTMQNCTSFMNAGYPINEKAKLIANQIDQYYASVNSVNTEYWERCIQF